MGTADSNGNGASGLDRRQLVIPSSAPTPQADPYSHVEVLARATLGQSAFEILRDSILTGRLFSGQHLVETTLAQELGISRGPLREALALLQKDGLVEVLPRRGRFVLAFTQRSVDEFYSLRKVMESLAVELVIESLDDKKERALKAAARRVQVAEVNRLMAPMISADLGFHQLLYDLSGHQLLQRSWADTMASKLRLLVHLTVPDEYQPLSDGSNHQPLVDAIHARDVRRARELAVDHIEDARQRAQRAVSKQLGLA